MAIDPSWKLHYTYSYAHGKHQETSPLNSSKVDSVETREFRKTSGFMLIPLVKLKDQEDEEYP